MSELSDRGCTCLLGHPPCSYCECSVYCLGCGEMFLDDEPDSVPSVCPTCQDKYRHIIEGHQLDCTCRSCDAFVNAADAEAGFKVAIPILIEEEARG